MYQSIALLSILAKIAFAEQTLEFFFPGGYDGVAPVASIVTANPTTTVLDLSCPTGVSSEDCGWGTGIRYSIVSTTIYEATVSVESASAVEFTCDHNTKKEEMTCNVSMDGTATSSVLSSTELGFIAATVTAGGELLGATGAASQSQSQATSSGLKTKASASAATAPAASVSGASATASGASATASGASATASGVPPAQTTAAAVRFGVEGSALLALVGAAALNAW
ncbi:uncharacterized protein BDR25DRAFT_300354 [Lindgomyces ingoldianus]|uniref:Uncharacterized protein n=1 Tax=Lindgomyces ingoldianus TaxID=673940 RepID=A0ACB6RCS1_9PLEO|nr:uncharacterized protein BDR25DRAFT_300354 [Lindgomyces ingoldianus]KAF2476271.1 hypothetical protein BDR25DRAFT_300354 [Lindgomyces ingoldianus]